jgi:hypothetical protein
MKNNKSEFQIINLNQPIMKKIIILFLAVTFPCILSPIFGQWNQHFINKDLSGAFGVYGVDMNGDNKLDIVASGMYVNRIVWYEAPLWAEHSIGTLGYASEFYVVDMDGDNDLDVIAGSYSASQVVWFEAPSWTMHYIDANLGGARDVQVADMDGDNDLDLVAVGQTANYVVWYEAPSWNKHVIDDNLLQARHIHVADMDDDDTLDVVATGIDADDVVWYEAPSWIKHFIDNNLNGARGLHVIDMDGDDTLDVVAVGFDDNDVVWYEAPSWTKYIIDDNLGGARDVQVVDMDGDNDHDIVAVGETANNVVWYEAPSWIKHVIDNNLNDTRQLHIVDMDSDNDPDVIATSTNDNGVVWYENLGLDKNVAYGETIEVHPNYLSPQGDTLFVNAQVTNPESHPVSVYLFIQGNETAFQDSIHLFDDGLHKDGEASDNIWGGEKLLLGLEEDAFTCELLTHDLTVGSIHRLFPAMILFTTIGPVVFENYTFDEKDTEPNPGDRLRLKLTLKNNSSIATATNIKAGLISLDPLLSVPDYSYSFDPIAAGENSNAKSYTINISEECPANTVVPIVVNISSYGYICRSDTFSITVLEPLNLEEIREPITRIYPNPTDNILNIEISNTGSQGMEIEILDITSTLFYQKEFTPTGAHFVEQLDLSGYAKGIYLIKVKQANTVYVGKVVVK